MTAALAIPDPCGACVGCRLGVEVQKTLEFIDRRFVPELEKLAREITEERWYYGQSPATERKFRRLKAEWHHQREKFLTADVINGTTCERTYGTIIFRPLVEPEPRDVNVLPRELEEISLQPQRCYRCGAQLTWAAGLFEIEVCKSCFGRDP